MNRLSIGALGSIRRCWSGCLDHNLTTWQGPTVQLGRASWTFGRDRDVLVGVESRYATIEHLTAAVLGMSPEALRAASAPSQTLEASSSRARAGPRCSSRRGEQVRDDRAPDRCRARDEPRGAPCGVGAVADA